MSFSRLTLSAIASFFVATAALADDASAPPASGGEHHSMMRGMFTPEERVMIFADMFKATAGMTDDQKREYRQQQRSRFIAMSESDRAKFKSDLDGRWNALPADQKAAMTTKMEALRASRHADGGQ
jgi:hypothetical protein